MAAIEIKRAHSFTKEEIRQKAQELATSLESKLGIQWHWNEDAIEFEAASGPAKGTKGTLRVSDTEIHILVQLPLLLRALKKSIEDKVKQKLDQLL